MVASTSGFRDVTRILLLYGFSGFVSLGYQVAWFRVVTDWFGSTNLTFALVVANFIGGLALGSLLSRRTSEFLTRRLNLTGPLRIYGVIELLVAASIGLTFVASVLPPDVLGNFPYRVSEGIWTASVGYRLLQTVIASTAVLVPCFFMGATFPLLCARLASHPTRGARLPAALYAWNTLGACTGVLACQFLLLPRIGHDATLALMAGLNALLGLTFLVWSPDLGLREGAPQPPREAEGAATTATPMALLALVTVGGFLAGALEGDLFKRVTFVIPLNPGATMSFISFWAILAIFLASSAVHRFAGLRLSHIRFAFVLAVLYCASVWPFVDAIRDFVEANVTPTDVALGTTLEGFRTVQFPRTLIQLLGFVGILVFPPYFLVSLLLPHVCNQLQGERTPLGLAYGLNTLAFCLGLLAFVLAAPMVNIFYSFKLFTVIFAGSALWLFLVREHEPLARWKPIALLAGIGSALLLVPADFDRSYFRPGSPPAVHPVRAVKSDGAHTTFVVDMEGWPRLFFGRLLMSATNLRAQTYMRLMAHFPLLLHENPEKALLICLGAGNTGSAIARHPGIRQIDVVDLNEKIFETAPEFAETNHELHLDPRVRFIADDGRSFLRRTDERYDLITSEPPPPLAAGIHRLYSEEYYRDALAHLTPKGFMTQWLPLFLMTPEAVEMAVSTFIGVFPHTLLLSGYGTDFILLGSPSPFDARGVDERLREAPEAAEELAVFNIFTPSSLLARIVQSDAALRRNYGAAPRISDQRNDLEHMLLDPRARPVVRYEPADVLAFLAKAAPVRYPETKRILTHLGRLRYHVQGYPFETLAAVEPGTRPEIALAGIDWMALAALSQENTAALRSGGTREQTRVLERFLEISREQPEVLLQLARVKRAVGRTHQAIDLLEEFLALEPEDFLGHQLLGDTLERAERAEDALASYHVAARLRPDLYTPVSRSAWIRATHSDPDVRDPVKAMQLVERAATIAETPIPEIEEARAAAYAANGQFDRAADVVRTILQDLPESRVKDRRRLSRQLRRYEAGRPVREGIRD